MVSIIILSYHAPLYTCHSLKTLKNTWQGSEYETIVLDNNSKSRTMLYKLKEKGLIDKLILEKN